MAFWSVELVDFGEKLDAWPGVTIDIPMVESAQQARSISRRQYEYQMWQLLATGAKCGGETKMFTRGYEVPEGWEFVEMVRIEEFEGQAWVSYIREDRKYWEMTTRCSGNELAKFRMHAVMRKPAAPPAKIV